MKGIATWVVSAISPISRKPQPPIGVIIRSEDADLGKIAQSRKGDTEDGREHDCLEKIVAHQGYQRHGA